MEIGIGLPATIPGVERRALLDWARRAEERRFSSLGTIDRLVYPNYEPLIAVAAAAAMTETIRLMTDILIVPYRGNAALLAKQAATVDALSEGRLTLGVGIGARPDDYEASGVAIEERGRLMDEMLAEMKACWDGAERGFAGPVGPPPAREGGPELLVGGRVDASFQRAARFGHGWTMGGGTPEQFAEAAGRVREEWEKAGREGEPRLVALCYFSLGEGAREAADTYLKHYYAIGGDQLANAIAESADDDDDMARSYRDGFADAGADELIYFPCSTDVSQVDLLTEAVL
jgi:alkanesulfonate monooxygenase SsuD/methylene tetrahydromethanopterin reductase-like flavin-dependent oxidoreductase (luciferase family)